MIGLLSQSKGLSSCLPPYLKQWLSPHIWNSGTVTSTTLLHLHRVLPGITSSHHTPPPEHSSGTGLHTLPLICVPFLGNPSPVRSRGIRSWSPPQKKNQIRSDFLTPNYDFLLKEELHDKKKEKIVLSLSPFLKRLSPFVIIYFPDGMEIPQGPFAIWTIVQISLDLYILIS